MNLHSVIPSRTGLAILCGAALAMGIAATQARADQHDKRTILTVNETIQVRDTVLEPGQYVMKLYESPSERHVVQIFNRDQTHIINTVLAIPRERLQPADRTEFTFWETPPGSVRAMRTWFYPGDTIGQEFPYPKHLQQMAMLIPPAPAVSEQTTTQETEANAAPAPEETPAPTAEPTPEPTPEQPAEIAQNTAPATPPPAETPSAPAQLPKTGSLYPAIGVCGSLLICLAGLLRLRRRA